MGEVGRPPGDECLGGGLAEGGWRGSTSTVGQQPDKLCRFLAPTTPNFECHNHEFASAPSLEFRVSSFFGPSGIGQSRSCVCPSSLARLPGTGERRYQGCVNRQLGPLVQRLPIGDHFDSPVVEPVDCWHIEVGQKGVGGNPGSGLSANTGCCSFKCPSSSSQDPRLSTRCAMVAKQVQSATASAGAFCQGKWKTKSTEQQDTEDM